MKECKNSFRDDNLQKLSERFLHLIQEILCMRKASKIVLERAMNTVKEENKSIFTSESLLSWSQTLLDREIDRYFKDLIEGIKQNSKECEEELFEILHERFSRLVQKKIYREQSQVEQEDGQDIVQNALKIVYEKCKTSQPKGTFIQWAQTILNNKYKEYRRKINKQRRRMKSLSEENYEPIYEKRLSDVVSKRSLSPSGENRKKVKMNTPEESKAEENIFNHALYRWHPVELSECEDLKNHLLEIIAGMGDRCKKVFSLLFSTGDIRAIHEAFPDLSRSRIDVIISRCRKRLKQEAIKRRIL